jgi:hypothetical protein
MLGYPTLMTVCCSILFCGYLCSTQWQQHSIVAMPVTSPHTVLLLTATAIIFLAPISAFDQAWISVSVVVIGANHTAFFVM